MPIDPTIPLQARLPKIDSPLSTMAQVSQVRNAMNQNRLADIAFADKEREIARENELRRVTRESLDQTTGKIDADKYRRGLAEVGDYSGLQTFEKSQLEQAKAQREAEKERLTSAKSQIDLIGQVAGAVKDEQSYAAGLATLKQAGIDVSQLPTKYDPSYVAQARQQALTAAQQIEQVWKQKNYDLDVDKFGETKRSNQATEGISRGNLGVAQANLGIRREELDIKRKETAAGKAPAGYRYREDGTLEAIPGGPADIKAGELGAKRERQQQGALDQADRIITKVDQSLAKVGLNTAGFGGSAMSIVPGSESRDLKADLETIKANLGFAELQAMRDASPTGGALGAIAVQELTALQSTVASLDQAQSPAQLKSRLGEIKTHYSNWKKAVEESRGAKKPSGDTQPKKITSDTDYNALPSGAEFIDPNGKKRRKP